MAFLNSAEIESQRAEFEEHGFFVTRQLFTPGELEELRAEASRLAGRSDLIETLNMRCRWQDHVTTGECMFDCFDPIIDLSPTYEQVARDPRLLEILHRVYDDEPGLLKDKLIFKRPGAKGYALHQDYIGWKSFPESFLTVIIAIDPTDGSNGATEVFPGYHKQGYMSARDGEYHELPLDRIDQSTGVLLNLFPGDVAVFSGFTPHRSGPNNTDRWRRQLYLSYNADSDGGDQRTAHYQDFHRWLADKYAVYGKSGAYFK